MTQTQGHRKTAWADGQTLGVGVPCPASLPGTPQPTYMAPTPCVNSARGDLSGRGGAERAPQGMSLPPRARGEWQASVSLKQWPKAWVPRMVPLCHILPFFSQAAPCHPSWLHPILSLLFTQSWAGCTVVWGHSFPERPLTFPSHHAWEVMMGVTSRAGSSLVWPDQEDQEGPERHSPVPKCLLQVV